MSKLVLWPAWCVGPDGEEKIFQTPQDLPEGWITKRELRKQQAEEEAKDAAGEADDNEGDGDTDAAADGQSEDGAGGESDEDTGGSGDAGEQTPETEQDKKNRLVDELRAMGVNPVSPTWSLPTLEKKLAEARAAGETKKADKKG